MTQLQELAAQLADLTNAIELYKAADALNRESIKVLRAAVRDRDEALEAGAREVLRLQFIETAAKKLQTEFVKKIGPHNDDWPIHVTMTGTRRELSTIIAALTEFECALRADVQEPLFVRYNIKPGY
jgi:hypothetical protein